MKKRIISVFLAALMIVSLLPTVALADNETPIDNVYFTMDDMPYAGDNVDDYGTYYDMYGYNMLDDERYDVSLAWYADDGESKISELIDTPYSEDTFEVGDYVMAVTITPETGYSAEDLKASDLAFVSWGYDYETGEYIFTKDPTAPRFEKIDGVFYARIHVFDYAGLQKIAAEKAGKMPEKAAQKLIAKGENYLVPGSVKYKAMSEHQLAVFDAKDFANDKTADYLGISSGIILSTGDASAAIKEGTYDDGIGSPRNGSYYNSRRWYGTYNDENQTNGDKDLYDEFNPENSSEEKYPQFDTATLEFTVQAPVTDYDMSMTFNYVYATCEMTEEPKYNDVFALFVSEGYDDLDEPSTDFTNYATMKVNAEDSDTVTVSNMKAAIQAADAAAYEAETETTLNEFYVSENSGVKFVDGASYDDDYDDYDFDDLGDFGLPYNGLTNVYSTTIPEIEGGKYYTVKLAIADASDAGYDGAVFLQANSLYFGIAAPKVRGEEINNGSIIKAFEQPDIQLGVKNYGTVYIVPAGQAYTTETALQEAAAKVWRDNYKNGVTVDENGTEENDYTWSDDVSIAGLKPGYYAAYLVAELGGEKVVSLPSETFCVLPYIALLPGNFADPSVNEEHPADEELTVNFGTAEYDNDTKTLTASNIEFITAAADGIVMPDGGTVKMSGDASVEARGDDGAALTSEGGLALENSGNLTLTAENGSGISSTGGGNITVAGRGTTTINAGVGISTTGDVTISSAVTVTASETGIDCAKLTINDGATLTINLTDEGKAFGEETKIVIPAGYEIIGGTIDGDGVFTPTEDATQVIIRKKAPVYYGDPTVTVPVSGDKDSVKISATVSGSNATVKNVTSEQLDKVGTGENVTVDLSGLSKSVSGVTIPKTTLENVAASDASGLEIKLPNGTTAVFDSITVAAVAEQAAGSSIQLVVDKDAKAEQALTAAQKETVKALNDALVLDAYFVSGGKRISDFKGGEAELTVSYPTTKPVRVWYVAEDGAKELVPSTFDGESAKFVVTHFSHYAIEILDGSSYAACPQDATCVYAKFTDTDTKAWYHDGVHFCVENGYMVGVAADKFAPSGTLSRAMIVTMLWRMEGEPVVNYAMTFKDVADGQWYTDAIRWAQSTGVVEGYNADSFGPGNDVTREQLAAILMRYAAYKGVDVSARADLAKFTDTASISAWALDNIKWANAVGIINGRTETTIVPTGNATRAEAACMIQRFCETVLEK